MFASIKLVPLAALACAMAVPATAAASAYNTAVLSDGPALYWQLDEMSGILVDNAASADGVGDGIASPASVLGAPGAFPLSPSSATLTGMSSIATATAVQSALAVEFWVKPTSASLGTFLTYGNQFELGYNNRRKLTLSVAGRAAKDTRVGLPLNRWTLVDVSLSTGAGGTDAQVFTNGGTWRVKTVKNAGPAQTAPAGTVTLGGAIGGIDELATFPTALTQTRALSHYVSTQLPLWTARPTVTGSAQSGQTLTATAGTWSNATSTGFQWARCDSADPDARACDDIPGATGATYLVQDADRDSYIAVTESSENDNGVGAVDSVAVGAVTPAPIANSQPVVASVAIDEISPQTDDTLHVTAPVSDPNGDPVTKSYQWFKSGIALAAQTAATLDLSVAGNGGVGDKIQVRVTPNDGTVDGAPMTSDEVEIVNAPPVIDPGTGTGIVTAPGVAAALPAALTGITPVAPGCSVRLLKVTPKTANVKGVGRLTVQVAKRKGGKVSVVVKAAKVTKKRLAKAVFKLDRKTLKRMSGKRLRRSFKLATLKSGKHALKLRVRPLHGKTRTVKITLRVTCR